MKRAVIWVLMMACGSQTAAPALTIDGPSQLRVDRLGPVDGPRVGLDDGARPDGVAVIVADTKVADFEDGRLIAKARGETQVTATWKEQSVVWTLVVDPAVSLRFLDAPASISVGQSAALVLEARAGSTVVEAVNATWASSNLEVAVVADGTITGNQAGLAFITARMGTSEAMAEVEVVAP